MDTMNETGATGWMLSFASATVQHCCDRLRDDYKAVHEEGCALALLRSTGTRLSRDQLDRLEHLGRRMTHILQRMGGAERSLLSAAERLKVFQAPDCPCERCLQERALLGEALIGYWGLNRPRVQWMLPGSGSV